MSQILSFCPKVIKMTKNMFFESKLTRIEVLYEKIEILVQNIEK